MDLSITSTRSVGGRIASNASWMFGAKAIGAALGLLALIITARALDSQAEFGIVIFLHGYMLFFAEMMTFQPWQSVIRFGSDDLEAGDGARFAKLVKFSAVLDLMAVILSYLAAIALFGVFMAVLKAYPDFWPGAVDVNPDRLFGLVAVYSSVVLFNQNGMSIGVLRLFDRFAGLAIAQLVMPCLRVIGASIAAMQGWGMIGFIAVWYTASVFRYLYIFVLGVRELAKRDILRSVLSAKVSMLRPRNGLWAFATKAYVDSSLAAGFTHLPLLLVMIVFGPAFLAVYKIAEEISRLLSEGVKLLDQVIYPELARIVAAGQGGQILRLVTKASLISLSVGLALSAFVYVFGPGMIAGTLGAGYEQSVTLAVLLVLGAVIFATLAPLFPVFYAVGKPERAIYARATGLFAYIISFILLTRLIGELGTGWAWIVGYGVAFILVVWLVLRTLRALGGESSVVDVSGADGI